MIGVSRLKLGVVYTLGWVIPLDTLFHMMKRRS